ncbi:ribosome maturation factor RimM [Paenibacillus alvei]|uniref:Ribosome maturation factor RimM n=1 Tax=Paenibacillus alvei TaxID=44250 RepID=A0AAP7A0X0_PAEAL|nr:MULTISPECIES: ribosome maturation factor RimM [Paenibacillus]EJW14508.1 ribosome maturation factor RimM [Paenibacillus alvei DSM 29]MBG9733149.1 16S rRNA processing protein RimM [Paenibacillus alvei]MBG9745291.1 16S rRNA processing protein RimM [Paenibacillus alvei]MCY7486466.1 ribosome maturation factor RimM [Paenibacillus alvei]MCY9542187.1 ribosome maturation factor RimM [Paenibacillus alvei]
MSQRMFNVGKLVNTHGIRGEVKIIPTTDFPETRFAQKSELILQQPDSNINVPVTIERSRLHKNMYIVKFTQFDNINDVEKYKGWVLKVSEEQLDELDDDEYYYHEIIGCKVVTDEGEELGVIEEILSPGANDVWVVKPAKGKSILLPVIDDVVLEVNVQEKIVKVHIMEGLI